MKGSEMSDPKTEQIEQFAKLSCAALIIDLPDAASLSKEREGA